MRHALHKIIIILQYTPKHYVFCKKYTHIYCYFIKKCLLLRQLK